MKRTFIYLALAVSVFCACQKENIEPAGSPAAEAPEFYAEMEGGKEDTKIHLGEYEGKYRVLWDGYNDLVAMCAGIDASSKYRVKGATANTPAAELYAEKDTDVATEGNAIADNVAYYPYPNSAKVGDVKVTQNEDGSYTVPGAFSDAQTYLAGSIPSRAFPIVAVSNGLDDNSLNFKNVAGGICFNVKGGAKIKKITFKSNEANKVIAGSADIKVSNTDLENSVPTYEFTGSSTSISLYPNAAVVTDHDEVTPFYIGVAPQTFPSGFNVTLEDSDGFSRTITTEKPREVRRSCILNMPAVTFPFYETSDWTTFNKGANTEYDAQTKTFTFAADQNSGRWFDLPSFINTDGGFAQHPTLKMWATSSNIVLTVILLHGNYTFDAGDGDGNGKETIVATLYGQTNKLVESVRTNLVTLDLYSKLCEKFTTEDATGLLKNVTGIRIKMHASATNAVAPYQVTFDRIVLE